VGRGLFDAFPEVVEASRQLKQAHERQEQLAAQLHETNQELESFSSAVSHDLRAPLRRISGFGQLLLEECGDQLDARGQDYVRRIDKATRNMAQLIEDLLELSRATRGELRHAEVDLSRLAQAAVEELRKSDGERQVEVVIQDGVVASGDARLLRIVLDKLLGNAWKYTRKTPLPRIEFGAEAVDRETRCFVGDNGVGFDMARSDRLFRPFHRLHTEDEFAGSGIGLATVKRIVSKHGGRVWAEAAEGKGARFYFQLPLPPITSS
jgi:signal transduction histidine kinase